MMSTDLAKTLSYMMLHLAIGFAVAYALTGDMAVAGGIAMIEPCVNAVAFFFHEKAWRRMGNAKAVPSLCHRSHAASI